MVGSIVLARNEGMSAPAPAVIRMSSTAAAHTRGSVVVTPNR